MHPLLVGGIAAASGLAVAATTRKLLKLSGT
jgi:hypothetical protein